MAPNPNVSAIFASVYKANYRWKEAKILYIEVLKEWRTLLGVDHSATLTIMNDLVLTCFDQGQWKEAEELLVETIERHKTVLGMDHPYMQARMSNLALTYCEQGRWKEAEELLVEGLEMSKTMLGADHPGTLMNINNLDTRTANRDGGRRSRSWELKS
jgi:tetratricopeptide (TPR) repeat protein